LKFRISINGKKFPDSILPKTEINFQQTKIKNIHFWGMSHPFDAFGENSLAFRGCLKSLYLNGFVG
jgi:hypothetical protein